MYGKIQQHLQNELNTIEQNGIFKKERIITSPQGAEITVNGKTVLNFCANNYLGLSSHPEVIQAAKTLWIRMVSNVISAFHLWNSGYPQTLEKR